MKRHWLSTAFATALCAATLTTALAQNSDAEQSQSALRNEPAGTSASKMESADQRWGMKLAPVPDLLRVHCPTLRPAGSLLVEQVIPQSPAARFGLAKNDIVLRVDGMPLTSPEQLPAPESTTMLMVLRQGHPRPLFSIDGPFSTDLPATAQPPGWNHPPMPPSWTGPQPWNGPQHLSGRPIPPTGWFGGSQTSASSASASSVSDGNQSISVSRAGSEIALEMVDPAIAGKPIRFRGNRDEIEQQVEASTLSDAAKANVLRTLQQVR